MDLKLNPNKPINLPLVLRQAGYHPIEGSWVRHLSRGYYPRFHLYEEGERISLHIDQKQTTMDLPGLKRHAGEYNSPVVAEEMERIKRWLAYAQQR